MLYGIVAITFFLSVIVVVIGLDLNKVEAIVLVKAIAGWWILGLAISFVVYLGINALITWYLIEFGTTLL